MNLIDWPAVGSVGNWTSTGTLSTFSYAQPSSYPVDGGLKVTWDTEDNSGNTWDLSGPLIEISPGQRLLRSGWVDCNITTTGPSLSVIFYDSDLNILSSGNVVTSSGGAWKHYATTISPPANTAFFNPNVVYWRPSVDGDTLYIGTQTCTIDTSGLDAGAEFLWLPSFGLQAKHQPRIRKAQFGDGYSQRSRDGLNTDLPTWNLTFKNRDKLESYLITSFCASSGGVDSFAWTDPHDNYGKFICTEYNQSFNTPHTCDVTATFKQVADLN